MCQLEMLMQLWSEIQRWRLSSLKKREAECVPEIQSVMNRLDSIEELYDMYSEKEDTLRIVEIEDDGLDFVLDIEGPVDPYMDL